MRSFLGGALLLVAGASGARATDVMATGPVGTFNENVGVCYLINFGTSSVTLTSIGIHAASTTRDVLIPSISNNCGGTLLPGATCRTVSNIGDSLYECKAVVSSKTNLRGELETRSNTRTVAHQA